jgi:hypothetical protein
MVMVVMMIMRGTMGVSVIMRVTVPGAIRVDMLMLVSMIVIMGAGATDFYRALSWQTATAFCAHNYSISIDANSISRPARNSALGVWHAGQALKRSPATNS